jgi:DNA-directed RNA polymerase subunit RPC12/RpoP
MQCWKVYKFIFYNRLTICSHCSSVILVKNALVRRVPMVSAVRSGGSIATAAPISFDERLWQTIEAAKTKDGVE